jgi:transcriptional regulator with XRE-family HTH domain
MNAEHIKKLRLRLGLTQEEFAIRLGLQTRSAICHLERGSKVAKGSLLELLKIMEQTIGNRENQKRSPVA